MDIYAPRSIGKLIFSILLATFGVFLAVLCFTTEMDRSSFSSLVVFAIALFGVSLWLFVSYFNIEVILHADEEGIFTMYQFYLPWEYIDKFYVRELENGTKFVEIKLLDNEKYISEMDQDIYTAYYDEIEAAMMHGHEVFYFPVTYMDLDDQRVIKFLSTAREKYTK